MLRHTLPLVMHQVLTAQGHALAIRARAEVRLAQEFDAAQDRGEIPKQGAHLTDDNMKASDVTEHPVCSDCLNRTRIADGWLD